jgi:hypothetical protein
MCELLVQAMHHPAFPQCDHPPGPPVRIAIGKITSLSACKDLGNKSGESVWKPVVEKTNKYAGELSALPKTCILKYEFPIAGE